MSGVTVRPKPEEAELANKEAELARLVAELSERELALASLRSQLAAFEGQYLRVVGVLYAELDEVNAQIAQWVAQRSGTREATRNATKAQQQAYESHSAAYGDKAKVPEFAPTAELRSLYRSVAKKLHPDLTSDPTDREVREKMMAEANRAYERGDAGALKRILEEYESSPDTVQGSGVASDLVRVIRKITQARNRLAQIGKTVTELRGSPVGELMMKADEFRKQGRDLLAELAEGVRKQIVAARQRLATP